MATWSAPFSVPGTSADIDLVLEVTTSEQSISLNRHKVSWSIKMVKGASGYPSRNNNDAACAVAVDGTVYSVSNLNYNFPSGAYTIVVASGSKYITHNADGTKQITVSAGYEGYSPIGRADITAKTFTLPTIPRASKSTLSPSTLDAGTATTITTNRASTGFTHTLEWFFGGASGTIATGVGASQSWTVPMSLLNEIPNATSGVGNIKTTTYSGSTVVGTATTPFTVTVPASVKPTISSISKTEAVAAVASGVGAFVQNVSKLNLGIVGAAGAYGSTIDTAKSKITVDEHVITATSGTTGALTLSGTRTITATVTDTRGRTGTLTTTVSVLAWSPPSINTTTLSVKRSFADGTLNDQGTNIKVVFDASVSSLMNGTEKNSLTYRISTRENGTLPWTVVATVPLSGITATATTRVLASQDITDPAKPDLYAIDTSWDVLLEVIDRFATSTIASTVATAKIFMHWDGSLGVGIGKYRTKGALDVAGLIYQNDLQVLDTGDIGVTGGAAAYPAISTMSGSAAPSAYPLGHSLLLTSVDATWPDNYLSVVTDRVAAGRGGQTAYRATTGQVFTRVEAAGDAWSPWVENTARVAQPALAAGSKMVPLSVGGATVGADGKITFTNVTSFDVNDVFDPYFSVFEIEFFAESTSQIGWLMNLRAAGVVKNDALYEHGVVTNGAGNAASGATTAATTAWIIDGGASGNFVHGSMTIRKPNAATSKWMHGEFYTRRTTGTLSSIAARGGLYRGATACDGFRISSTAAFSGECNVYAIR